MKSKTLNLLSLITKRVVQMKSKFVFKTNKKKNILKMTFKGRWWSWLKRPFIEDEEEFIGLIRKVVLRIGLFSWC